MKKILNIYRKQPVTLKAANWFVVCSIIQKSVMTITTPIFTRLMSTSQQGLFELFSSWYNVIVIFANLNLFHTVYNHGLVKFQTNRTKFSSAALGFSTTWTLLIFVVYFLFNDLFNNFIKLPFFMMVCMLFYVFFAAPIDFWTANKRYTFEYKKIVSVTIVYSIVPVILSLIIIPFTEFKAETRVLCSTVFQVVSGVIFFVILLLRGKCFFDKEYWRFLFFEGIILFCHQLSMILLNNSDKIMIGHFFEPSKVAIYGIACSIGNLVMFLGNSINSAFVPWLYQRLKINRYEKTNNVSISIILMIAGLCLFIICLGPELTKLFAPPSYYEAIYMIPSLVFSMYLVFVYTIFINLEIYYNKPKLVSLVSIACAIINIILNYLALPVFGYKVAAYTTLISYGIAYVCHVVYIKKLLKDNKLSNILNVNTVNKIVFVLFMVCLILQVTYKYIIYRFLFFIFIFVLVVLKRQYILEIIRDLIR